MKLPQFTLGLKLLLASMFSLNLSSLSGCTRGPARLTDTNVDDPTEPYPALAEPPPDEDGSRLWLRYPQVNLPGLLKQYQASVTEVVRASSSATLEAAETELVEGLSGLLGAEVSTVAAPTRNGAVILGTPESSPLVSELSLGSRLEAVGKEGYLVDVATVEGTTAIVVAGNSDAGVLRGAFALLRHLSMHQPLEDLPLSGAPKIKRRLLNHWDNLDGFVERGYAGPSLWNWPSLPGVIPGRLRDYARANASIGINGAVLNNVNSDAQILAADSLDKVAALADVFRPYGIAVYLSARFSAPIEIGGLETADPLATEVQEWWTSKVTEIYEKIPDFGGFLVKANSEGQPGPQDYGRTHVDGANMLAEVLAPHDGVVMWRAFVYEGTGIDRVRQAYDEFQPLDGSFESNVFVQAKNGPLDFQPREPFNPLFGAMPQTSLALELQITKEYLGMDTHLAYLGPLYEEVLQSDTYASGEGSLVARVVDGTLDGHVESAIAGVSNVGSETDWTGSHFNQANWYVFGRMAWDPDISAQEVADEWIRQTFSNDPIVVEPVTEMMMSSRETLVNYMTPLGLVHIMGTGHHYGPGPWVSNLGPTVTPFVYHRADSSGIGIDRTSSGTGALTQYADANRDSFESRSSVPDELLLFFHRVDWDEKLKSSGRSVWHELVHRYSSGVDEVGAMRDTWKQVEGRIDDNRYGEVAEFLEIQHYEARLWRDACLAYFASRSDRPIPDGYSAPMHDLNYYQDLAEQCPGENAYDPRCPEVYTGDPSPAITNSGAEP